MFKVGDKVTGKKGYSYKGLYEIAFISETAVVLIDNKYPKTHTKACFEQMFELANENLISSTDELEFGDVLVNHYDYKRICISKNYYINDKGTSCLLSDRINKDFTNREYKNAGIKQVIRDGKVIWDINNKPKMIKVTKQEIADKFNIPLNQLLIES